MFWSLLSLFGSTLEHFFFASLSRWARDNHSQPLSLLFTILFDGLVSWKLFCVKFNADYGGFHLLLYINYPLLDCTERYYDNCFFKWKISPQKKISLTPQTCIVAFLIALPEVFKISSRFIVWNILSRVLLSKTFMTCYSVGYPLVFHMFKLHWI